MNPLTTISRVIPVSRVQYNGVTVPNSPGRMPWPTLAEQKPNYEGALIPLLDSGICAGDRITILGGGYGVSAVKAAEFAGSNGSVVCYEAAGEAVSRAREVADLNGVGERITIHNRVVETGGRTRGDDLGEEIPLGETADSDVLVIDVDGVEDQFLALLPDSGLTPRTLIVEHHAVPGGQDYHPDETMALIRDAGYRIIEMCTRKIGEKFGGEETVFLARRE